MKAFTLPSTVGLWVKCHRCHVIVHKSYRELFFQKTFVCFYNYRYYIVPKVDRNLLEENKHLV